MASQRPTSTLGQYAPVSYIPRPRSGSGSGNTSLSRSGGPGSMTPATTSLSASSGLPVLPSTALASRTLKRTSHQAGLAAPTPLTARKRTLSGVPSTPAATSSSSLASLKADLEASASQSTLQRQLGSSQRENGQLLRELGAIQERVKNLEKERAILLAQQEKYTSRDEQRDLQDKKERKELVVSLSQFREKCALLEEQKDLLKSHQSSLSHRSDIAEQEKENALKELEVLQEELQKVDEENSEMRAQKQSLKEAQETIEELRKQLAEQQAAKPAQSQGPQQDLNVSEVLRKELHHQVQHLKTLEHNNSRLTREVTALKADRANVELLKEEKLSLETKLRRMESLRKKLADVELECGALRREKEEWASYLSKSCSTSDEGAEGQARESFTSPAQMAKTLASARIELLSLQEKLGAAAASLKSRDDVIVELEGRVAELQDVAIPHWEVETQKVQDRLRATERNAALDQKELDMLREQIKTYATEEASMLASGDAAYDSQKSLQIKHLGELLEAHKAETVRSAKEAERLRGLLEARGDDTQSIDATTPGVVVKEERRTSFIIPGTPSRHGEAINGKLAEQIRQNEELQDALRTAREELAEMQAELDSLDAQIDNLNHALGRGEYNTETTKVLTFEENPAALDLAVRTETLDNLREENRVLLEKVSELEERARHAPSVALSAVDTTVNNESEETVPKQTYVNLHAEKEDLIAKIEQAEKSRQRLKEIFSKTAQDLRDVCRSLFGYRIEPLENSRVKVTTVFGGSDYNLVFGPAVDPITGKAEKNALPVRLTLVGGNEAFVTSSRVQQGLEFWVAQRQCLPGFLSSLTLEVFEESTRGRTAGYSEA